MTVIDMQRMRYINLLDKIAHVKTRKCFVHNNAVFFAVARGQVVRAIGPAASHVKKLQESIGKRIRIIWEDEGIEDAKRFIVDIVAPVRIKSVDIDGDVLVVTSGNNQSKASLIGRDKRRYEELRKIVQDYFGKDLKIV